MRHPALLIAGTHSGCGKTTVTLGIMAVLHQRGFTVHPFKCGPDFIDPTLHRLITGNASRSLDVRMCGPEYVQQTFSTHAPAVPTGRAISIIEGVMGLFDGGTSSAAHLAILLGLPVILVVDVRSAAESVAAVVKGFESLDPQVRLAGVICNRTGSERHVQMVTDAVRQHCRAEVIGSLPRENGISLPSRHLGLHMGTEIDLNRTRLIELMEEHLDVDRLVTLAGEAQVPQSSSAAPLEPVGRVRLGLARDAAFCFYYQDNLDMLETAGAELVLFSPLHDKTLPENLDGLYLGGGYPELHAEALSANEAMREAVLAFSRYEKPVYAECGGFMYLTEAIFSADGQQYPMVGVYPVTSRMQPRLRSLGYRQAEMRSATILGPAGSRCYGHEFHYSAIDAMPEEIKRGYLLDGGREEGYVRDNTLAGYVHLHWGRTPEVPRYFVRMMQKKGTGRVYEFVA
ncbi:MAG: cobyrinate a,c-diamide synthase [Candidatus Electrothrix sp. YB6]